MNKALYAAYKKGLMEGRKNGSPLNNPYWNGCTDNSRGNWNDAFYRYWERGLRDGINGCSCPKPPPDDEHRMNAAKYRDGNFDVNPKCPVHGVIKSGMAKFAGTVQSFERYVSSMKRKPNKQTDK